ncbi:DUF695 domain-containing protein [Sphingobacterium sp. IITKGP-BTPF85]|uniref:DUF695 domain-containing protein n=1 Tax=Sphingobacterium sp. IITKGP-BTPF85 TaxID=1338009 RepID=UPI00038A38B9|nr:DUF695 domain-containing protein [Sphingobacterium sp. IITKGP-BTPF85]KKX46462.1 hypothetical protein L950_0231805 [Sphingobacterium sp. IITKGP-BTPF85]
MTDYKVLIPDESYSVLNFKQDNFPGVAVVNNALREFEPKIVFAWHLSIMIDLDDLIDNGMPSKSEVEVIDNYGDYLDNEIKGPDKDKPNALFLARITWNKTRELIWRVYDPEISNSFLQEIITANSSPRQFDYRIDPDNNWELAKWHLTDWK